LLCGDYHGIVITSGSYHCPRSLRNMPVHYGNVGHNTSTSMETSKLPRSLRNGSQKCTPLVHPRKYFPPFPPFCLTPVVAPDSFFSFKPNLTSPTPPIPNPHHSSRCSPHSIGFLAHPAHIGPKWMNRNENDAT
jgi:hypothetical protein